MKTTLGLDLGTNSIGWALLGHDDEGALGRILAAGVRIFSAAVDDKTKTPLNFERRAKRLLRRQISRRRQRRDLVRNLLIRNGMLPVDVATTVNAEGIWNGLGDTYDLRTKGLDHPLTLHEFGRVLMHLQRHRGFQSNRRADRGAKEADEATQTDAGIAELRVKMNVVGARTLGEWLHRQDKQRNTGARWLWTERAMLREEFASLWEVQARFAPTLTDDLYREMHDAIFWQRPLKSQAGTKGGCSLEAVKRLTAKAGTQRKDSSIREVDEIIEVPVPRAAMAWQDAQRARYWQDLNHLTLRDPRTGAYAPITQAERQALAKELELKDSLTWKIARKIVGRIRSGSEPLTDAETFNLEDGGKDKLIGNRTAVKLRKELEGTPVVWDDLPVGDPKIQQADERSQATLIKDLLTIDDHAALHKRFVKFWNFSDRDAQSMIKIHLEATPGRLSLKALAKLLPHLMAGKNYHDACQSAGYQRHDQQTHTASAVLGAPPEPRNPVVAKCLHEVRKVINALIRVHGLPDHIRVEMARDLKLSPSQRDEVQKAQKKLERLNVEADAWWKACGVDQPSHDNRVKFRLWKQQGECSAYSDRAISQTQLRSGEIQIDHILPYSRSFDDSFGNKALCFADENADKNNRTPWEWLGGNAARWDAFMSRLRSWKDLSIGARRRLTLQKLELDDFLARQLNDTRYLSRETLHYLGSLYPSHTLSREGEQRFHYPVQVTAGKATAGLRHFWGFNGLLSADGTKNRTDHRHHLVDAVVIACTDRRLYARISAAMQRPGTKPLQVEPPWATIRSDVASVLEQTVVSHAQDHRLSGALHEDTAYGLIPGEPKKNGSRSYCYRVAVEKAAGKPDAIRDATIRELVTNRLAQFGGDVKNAKKAFEAPLLHHDGKTIIRSVRIEVVFNERSVRGFPSHAPVRYHKLGGNHHVEIIRLPNGKCEGRFVSTIDAARRVRINKLPMINRTVGTDGAFVMALHINDTVEVPCEGRRRFYRVQKMSEGIITLRDIEAASLDEDAQRMIVTPNSMVSKGISKVVIDAIGQVTSHADPRGGNRQSGPPTPG